MKWLSAIALAALLAGSSLPGPAQAAEPGEAQLIEARKLAQAFFTSLKGELEAAMAEGGPVNAIGVCRTMAPGIAGELSQKSGWAVGRTALRVRNPRNAPSVRERAVLMDFLARSRAGQDIKTMESAAVIEEGGRRYLHYMKAIPTGEVCLTCHGSELSPQLRRAIHEVYPSDAATGFEAGELRGAFTFVKPLN